MSNKTYYSAFFPPADEPGKKGSTIPVVTTGVVDAIQTDIGDIYTAIDAISAGGFGDTTPPASVTGFGLSSSVALDTDGTQIVSLTASWTAVADADLSYYVIALKENTGAFIEFIIGSTSTSYSWSVRGNQSFTAKIRAADKAGNLSAWTSDITITSAKDTVAPNLPTSLTVEVSLHSAFLRWVSSNSLDVAFTEIWENTSNTTSGATKIATVAAYPVSVGAFTRTSLTAGDTRYYFLKAVDSSGNVSGFTSSVTAVTPTLAFNDFASGLGPVLYGSTLPTTGNYLGKLFLLTTNNKLYRWDGSSWITSVATTDLSGQIINTQITPSSITANEIAASTITGDRLVAGTISAAQIAAGAITATKLLIGNTDNIITDGNFQDINWWYTSGSYAPATLALQAADTNSLYNRRLSLSSGSSANVDFLSKFFPVEIGATYKISTSIIIGSDFSGYINCVIHMPNLQWFSLRDGTGQDPNGTFGPATFTTANTTNNNDFIYTNPTGVTNNANNQWQFRIRGVFSGTVYFMVKIVRVSDNTLIQDGAITTTKLVASAVTADKITAGAITTNKIAAGAVTTDRLSLGVINKSHNNLLDSNEIWDSSIPPNTNIGVWVWNSASGNDNYWLNYLNGPNGTNELLLSAVARITGTAAGGWNTQLLASRGFSNTKSYRYYCWVYNNDSNGSIFHGCTNVVNLNGTANGNPYFFSGKIPLGKWYLAYGVIHSKNYTGVDTGTSGLYDPITGTKYINGIDYKWDSSVTLGGFRTYHYYSGIVNSQMFFTQPVVEEINGQSTPLAALLFGLDYASSINNKTTTIVPGKITISGATTLADWRNGSDLTKIEGGSIAANTVATNKLTVGNRGIGFIGINFEWNPSNNYVYWSEGYVYYVDNNGNPAADYITAGNSGGVAAHRFFLWYPGNTNLQMVQTHPAGDNFVMLATWWGGSNLNVTYGGTIINGDRITTNTLNANKITAGTITADKIAASTIGADKLAVTQLSAITANVGLLRTASTGARMEIEANQQRVYDASGTLRVKIGQL